MANGNVNYNTTQLNGSYPVNTNASFSCTRYYMRYGPSSVICQSSENWSEETSTCNVSNENKNFFYLKKMPSSMLQQTGYLVSKFVI